jgi:hypothetical protein
MYYFPLAHNSITNYDESDYNYIDKVQRKKGTKVQNVSEESLYNLKNRKPSVDTDIDDQPFD